MNFTGIPLTNATVQVYVDKYPNSTSGKLVGAASYLNSTNVAITAVYDSAKGGIQYVFFDIFYQGMHIFILPFTVLMLFSIDPKNLFSLGASITYNGNCSIGDSGSGNVTLLFKNNTAKLAFKGIFIYFFFCV